MYSVHVNAWDNPTIPHCTVRQVGYGVANMYVGVHSTVLLFYKCIEVQMGVLCRTQDFDGKLGHECTMWYNYVV